MTTGRTDGEGFVRCGCGQSHWGTHGAAGLLLFAEGRGVLLHHRAQWTHQGDRWALPGGALVKHESPAAAALREAAEEAAIQEDQVQLLASSTVDHGDWRYTTVLAEADGSLRVDESSPETAELRWVDPDEVANLPLHGGFAGAWPALRAELGNRLVLIVDAANVVGSRPDGWWRDRAGAAERLRDQLAGLAVRGAPATAFGLARQPDWSWWPYIELVVEGAARGVRPVPGVRVSAAERDGDTEIVLATERARRERPHDHLVVVTADRQLRERVRAEGATVIGPRAVRDAL